MEYIFGNKQHGGVNVETLKTVDSEHSNLSGNIQIIREYPDCTITDSCCIMERYHTAEDEEGNCYDWYIISNHWRNIDKSEKEIAKTNAKLAALTETNSFLEECLVEMAEKVYE